MLRNLAKAASVGQRSMHSPVPVTLPAKLANSLENIDPCQVTTLENGFKIATQHTNYPTGTIGIYTDSGSRYETPGFHGASNFIEHLLFRGTKSRSGEQVRNDMAKLGLQTSVNTSREIVSVENRCLAKDVDAVVANLGDVVCNVNFKNEDVDNEKDIIMRRIQARTRQYKDLVMDYAHNTSFMGTPLENNLIGLSDTVLTMNSDDLQTYHRNHWLAPGMVLVAVGPYGHDQIVELAQKHFANLPTAPGGEYPYRGPSRFTAGELEYRDDSFPMVYVGLAFEGVGFGHPDNVALDVVGNLVGQYDRAEVISGQHVLTWRNEMGNPLRYEGQARVFVSDFFNINYRDNGLWGMYFEMEDEDFVPDNTIHKIFRNEFCRYALGPADEEIELGKEISKCRVIREETSSGSLSLARTIGKEVMYTGFKKPLLSKVDEIENVQTADIRDVFQRRFYDMDFSSVKVGRTSSMPENVLMRTWNYRWLY